MKADNLNYNLSLYFPNDCKMEEWFTTAINYYYLHYIRPAWVTELYCILYFLVLHCMLIRFQAGVTFMACDMIINSERDEMWRQGKNPYSNSNLQIPLPLLKGRGKTLNNVSLMTFVLVLVLNVEIEEKGSSLILQKEREKHSFLARQVKRSIISITEAQPKKMKFQFPQKKVVL